MATDKLAFVPLSKIKVSPRTREYFGDMEGLVESIRDKGIIQPVTISDKYELLAGERRLRAAKEAGLTEIPCIIRPKTAALDALEIELIENVFRENFSWDERALHIKKLNDYCAGKQIDWSGRKLAKLLNRSGPGGHISIARDLKLAQTLEVFPELKEADSQDEALKMVKRLEEGAAVQELRRRQETSRDRGLVVTLKRAKANYVIGDCFKEMAELRTNGMVHFIELDPPYAIELDEKKGGASQRARAGWEAGNMKTMARSYNEIAPDKYAEFMRKMATETYRVANQHAWMICWFGPTHFTLVKDALVKAKWSVNDVPAIWMKSGIGAMPSGQTAAPEFNLANCYEPFFICRKGSPVLVRRGRANVFQFSPTPPSEKYHPTERPLPLMLELLAIFTMPSQTCLVPCLGSGVTLRACYLHGLTGWGFDLSKEYLDRFLLAVDEDTKGLDKGE